MFGIGIGWIKGLAFAVVLTTISGVIFGGYQFVTGLQSEVTRVTANNAILTADKLQLQQGISEQQETISSLEADITLQTTIINDTTTQFTTARNQVSELRNRLGQHELEFLAANKPSLVENIINDATDDIGRCFEIVTGSPLTADEFNATLPSEINTECPQIANPNFRTTR
jgi:hypothetical protein